MNVSTQVGREHRPVRRCPRPTSGPSASSATSWRTRRRSCMGVPDRGGDRRDSAVDRRRQHVVRDHRLRLRGQPVPREGQELAARRRLHAGRRSSGSARTAWAELHAHRPLLQPGSMVANLFSASPVATCGGSSSARRGHLPGRLHGVDPHSAPARVAAVLPDRRRGRHVPLPAPERHADAASPGSRSRRSASSTRRRHDRPAIGDQLGHALTLTRGNASGRRVQRSRTRMFFDSHGGQSGTLVGACRAGS